MSRKTPGRGSAVLARLSGGLWVEPGHPEAEDTRLRALAACFARRGAAVRVFAGADNSIAKVAPGASGWGAVVQVEGLANLVHELVHALLAGRIDDDHGIDYGQIPFDLGSLAGRAMLWDELAACTWSCAYGPFDPAAWFAEQVEIQPVFYGLEAHPERFFDRVSELMVRARDEAEAMVARAGALIERELGALGLSWDDAGPRRPADLHGLWRAYRSERRRTGGGACTGAGGR